MMVVPSEGSKGSKLHKTRLISEYIFFKAVKFFHFLLVHSCVILKRSGEVPAQQTYVSGEEVVPQLEVGGMLTS